MIVLIIQLLILLPLVLIRLTTKHHTVSANDTTVELKTSSQEQIVSFTVTVSDNVAINTVSLPGTTLLYTTTSGSNTQYNLEKHMTMMISVLEIVVKH